MCYKLKFQFLIFIIFRNSCGQTFYFILVTESIRSKRQRCSCGENGQAHQLPFWHLNTDSALFDHRLFCWPLRTLSKTFDLSVLRSAFNFRILQLTILISFSPVNTNSTLYPSLYKCSAISKSERLSPKAPQK